ncbi:MAG: hypothetical protein GEV07_17200 [Streptosporangiales bacterium]|nr:hypothetical protein [Streptosporangiales bacterium]
MTTAVSTRPGRLRRSPGRAVLLGAAYLMPAALALVVTKPGWVGLSATPGFLHLVSFPALMGIGWLVYAVTMVPFVLLTRQRYVGWLALVGLLAAALNLGTVALRGIGTDQLPAAGRATTVLTLNTLGGATSPRDVADLVVRTGADVVALPETPRPLAEQVAATTARRDRPMQVFGGAQSPFSVGATSLLVAESLGRYRPAGQPQTGLGAVVAAPVRGDGLVVAAVHSPPPRSGSARTAGTPAPTAPSTCAGTGVPTW